MSDGSGFQVPPELRDHAFSSWFADFLESHPTWHELVNGPTPLDEIPAALGGTMQWAQDASDPPTILKAASYITVPDELLMDAGIIPDTRERKPLPWRWRIRNRIGGWRESLARRAYRIIAGYDVYEPEDC